MGVKIYSILQTHVDVENVNILKKTKHYLIINTNQNRHVFVWIFGFVDYVVNNSGRNEL